MRAFDADLVFSWTKSAYPFSSSSFNSFSVNSDTINGFDAGNLTSKGIPRCITTCFKKIFTAFDKGIPNWPKIDSA